MKSSCEITFEGLNINRLLNEMCRKGYTLRVLERQGKLCRIRVFTKQSDKVVALLREKCYNVTNIKYMGMSAIAEFAKKRLALPVIIVILIISLAVSSRFCWKIDVWETMIPG